MPRGLRRQPSPMRRLLFAGVTVALVWVALEIAAMGLHVFANGHPYPKSALKREMKASARGPIVGEPVVMEGGGLAWAREETDRDDVIEVIHPYLGFVLDGGRNAIPVSDTGFIATPHADEPLPKRGEGVVVVGVFGGSFANGIAHRVREAFEGCDAFEGRRVEVRNVALAGYKQPQQVLALAYLSGLGAEFDLVLNIDGFNEVVLPLAENVVHGVHPHHPRMWHLRAGTVLDPERARAIGRLELVRDARDRWARLFLGYKLYRSPALALVWQLGDAAASRRARVEEDVIASPWPDDARSAMHGPSWEGEGRSDAEVVSLLADHWMRASIQMRALAEAGGARYVHVLQPNQYVAGSKPMSAAEAATAIGKGRYGDAARLGYPMLLDRVAALREGGVELVDLTGVFAEHEEALYVDDCCHVSPRGYALVAEAICGAL